MIRSFTVLSLLSLLAAGCAATTGAKGEVEDIELADGDVAADAYTRRLSVRGTIGFGESIDSDYSRDGYYGWLFTGTAGSRALITTTALDATDSVLYVYGPLRGRGWSGARPIAVNDDYRGSLDSHVELRLPTSGTYLIVAREFWGDAGSFTLSLDCGSAECRAECGADDSCPTGSECNRVVCIRAPCPSFCAPIDPIPAGECHVDECGAPLRAAVIMCEDGSLGGNTGRCLQHDDGSCGWELRACPVTDPTGTACGGRLGTDVCTDGFFCAYPAEAICGRADGTGTCARRPEACIALFDPVCGCDGHTYGNYCTAASAGVSVDHDGECATEPTEPAMACGTRGSLPCAEGQFCNFALSAICGATDHGGTCETQPSACTREYAPVCGCDGLTYSNTCTANAAGVSVSSEGECL